MKAATVNRKGSKAEKRAVEELRRIVLNEAKEDDYLKQKKYSEMKARSLVNRVQLF